MSAFLSDHLEATRDALKGHVHGGKTFSSDEIVGLVACFDELVSMARSQENELLRHQWNEAARRDTIIADAGNVVAFPGKGSGLSRHPSDTGGAV
jgi:hypothetical protein